MLDIANANIKDLPHSIQEPINRIVRYNLFMKHMADSIGSRIESEFQRNISLSFQTIHNHDMMFLQ